MTSENDIPKALAKKNQFPISLSPEICLIMGKHPDISEAISSMWGSTELYDHLKSLILDKYSDDDEKEDFKSALKTAISSRKKK